MCNHTDAILAELVAALTAINRQLDHARHDLLDQVPESVIDAICQAGAAAIDLILEVQRMRGKIQSAKAVEDTTP